ncbi:hypothetical protein NXS19_000811 [Fusarium pseudograminearum]|nr:hypothetical protein NXS19_000811 [Fusarium pseudograminearum]
MAFFNLHVKTSVLIMMPSSSEVQAVNPSKNSSARKCGSYSSVHFNMEPFNVTDPTVRLITVGDLETTENPSSGIRSIIIAAVPLSGIGLAWVDSSSVPAQWLLRFHDWPIRH